MFVLQLYTLLQDPLPLSCNSMPPPSLTSLSCVINLCGIAIASLRVRV